jgi:hypothetical protein
MSPDPSDRPAGRERGRGRRRRQGGLCARLHHGLRARLRFALWRARHAAVRGDSASASQSPAPSSRTRRSFCSTRRPRRSIPNPNRRSRRRFALCARAARRSSSPAGCRRSRKPMERNEINTYPFDNPDYAKFTALCEVCRIMRSLPLNLPRSENPMAEVISGTATRSAQSKGPRVRRGP